MSTEVFFVLKEKCMEYRLQYVPVTSLNTHFSQSGELHFSGKKKSLLVAYRCVSLFRALAGSGLKSYCARECSIARERI